MAATGPGASYRVLLVGVDAYERRPLRGCVNDIDAVQRLLIGRLEVPPARIRRLASPLPGRAQPPEVPAQRASIANVRAALEALAEEAREGDRVLIYYSGHGFRVAVEAPGRPRYHLEGLALDDTEQTAAEHQLYDREINAVLARIAARTPAVAVVLDCCHSAGVPRSAHRVRRLEVGTDVRWRALVEPPAGARGGAGRSTAARGRDDRDVHVGRDDRAGARRGTRIASSVDACVVVAACMSDELAEERVGRDGVAHGLLTRALVGALEAVPAAELATVSWARIWERLRAQVEGTNPAQHLWMAGHPGRAVLAGPPVDADAGLPIRRIGDEYEIGAGTLADITEAAELAVYGEETQRFPPLGSAADRAARRGTVRVTAAHLATATARAAGAPFELPPGARARLVVAGRAARLRCAIEPADAALAAQVRASPLLELVAPDEARVRLVHERARHRWLLLDAHHHAARGGEPANELFRLAPHQLAHARAVLEHYAAYSRPLRMAEALHHVAGELCIQVLAVDPGWLDGRGWLERPDRALPEAPALGGGAYELREWARVCFEVRSDARHPLRVTLVEAGSSGRVSIFGSEVISPGSAHRFWANGERGLPFEMNMPPGQRLGIDHLVAIGCTSPSATLDHLRVDRAFADLVGVERGPRDVRAIDLPRPPPLEQWTAARAVVRTRRETP